MEKSRELKIIVKPFYPIAEWRVEEESFAANVSINYAMLLEIQGEFTGFNQLNPKFYKMELYTENEKEKESVSRMMSFVHMCVGFFLFLLDAVQI